MKILTADDGLVVEADGLVVEADGAKPLQQEIDEGNPMTLPRIVSDALYVTDLDPAFVTEALLYDLFSQVGIVLSVKLCRSNSKLPADLSRPCHAYVNFTTVEEACNAFQTLNYTNLNGSTIRIMFSNLDPALRYNKNANLVIKNLEESIDSEALHHTFSAIGVVLSCKVERDRSSGKSLGYGFLQFQDEEDAQRAIRLVNGKLLEGKKVYLGPFIPRSALTDPRILELAAMNLNPLELNPAHINAKTLNSYPSRSTPSPDLKNQVVQFETINLNEIGTMSNRTSSSAASCSNSSVHSLSDDDDEEEPSSGDNDDDSEASRIIARARAADMIDAAKDAILAHKKARMPRIDPSYVPSSEAWAPQPWSVATLQSNLALSHLPEERVAMLGATLLPLVWKCTDSFVTDITNELVKTLDIEDIMHLMESAEALQAKVEGTKIIIMKRIQNQAPFVPKTRPLTILSPPHPSTDPSPSPPPAHVTPPVTPPPPAAWVTGEAPFAVGLQAWTGIFQPQTMFQKGTGFFDVSLTEHFRINYHSILPADQDHIVAAAEFKTEQLVGP